MVDIQSVAAEIRRGKKDRKKDRKKLQGKYIMAPLLHRAAIRKKIETAGQNIMACSITQGDHN